MKRLFLQLGFSLAAILLFLPMTAHAADTDVNVTVTVNHYFYCAVDKTELYFEVTDYDDPLDYNVPPSNVDPLVPYPLNWDGYGWTETDVLKMMVWANAKWKVMIKGTLSTFDNTSPWDKPVEDILWQDGDPTKWHHLSQSDAEVHNGIAPGSFKLNGQPNPQSCTFRVLLQWDKDINGTYTYNGVQFTAMAK